MKPAQSPFRAGSRLCRGQAALLAAFLVAAAVLSWSRVLAASPHGDAPEFNVAKYEVESAYLLNFARFVEWPDDAFDNDNSAVTIGIMGPGSPDREVENGMEERTIRGRPIRIVNLEDAEAVTQCQIVFLTQVSSGQLERILAASIGRPILTVSESESFAASGGVIQFYTENEVVRFEINPSAAERNRLKISSRLLALARLTPTSTGGRKGVSP
jgi:hypothetical protein